MTHSDYYRFCLAAEDVATAAVAAPGPAAAQSPVDAEGLRMTAFANGSPVALMLDVLESHPELRAQFLEILHMRIHEITAAGAATTEAGRNDQYDFD